MVVHEVVSGESQQASLHIYHVWHAVPLRRFVNALRRHKKVSYNIQLTIPLNDHRAGRQVACLRQVDAADAICICKVRQLQMFAACLVDYLRGQPCE